MPEEEKLYTAKEAAALVSSGVQEAKLDILIGDFTSHKSDEEKVWGKIDAKMEGIASALDKVPDRIMSCRDELEDDMRTEFLSKSEAAVMEAKFKTTIKTVAVISNGVLLVLSTGVLLATLYGFFSEHEVVNKQSPPVVRFE